ncbi:hypothetical protein [Macrococcus sp. DPC7161]|uniref:hypothetical protein n=1 Tax=Macrococcus sp. DPC7161 TaxID=2507060 RepID=UPI00100AC2FB|nr:hypothetical protein [Macrococcus sp. DPC7161]RXK17650.1 hypothetical protein ER639_08915 [Macrococcus sp. DPC7161]
MRKWMLSVVCIGLLSGCSDASEVKEKTYKTSYKGLHELHLDGKTLGLISKNKAQTKATIQTTKQQILTSAPPAMAYLDVASDYSNHMNEVFTSISKEDDPSKLEEKYHKVIKEIATYEAKKETTKVPEKQKAINENINKANEKYIDSISKINAGVEKNNETLKEAGFKEAAEGHVYFQKAAIYMSKMQPEISIKPIVIDEPSTPVIKEVYTSETSVESKVPTSNY